MPPTVSISVNALAAARPVHDVGDDGAPDHHAARTGEALHEARRDQHRELGAIAQTTLATTQTAALTISGPSAAVAVRQRSHHQLTERQADEERGQRELDAARTGVERLAHRREAREVEVGRDRGDRRQRGEDEEEGQAYRPVLSSSSVTTSVNQRVGPSRNARSRMAVIGAGDAQDPCCDGRL